MVQNAGLILESRQQERRERIETTAFYLLYSRYFR